MLLESLIDGSNLPKITIIQETADVSATAILLNFLRNENLKKRTELIHFVNFQHPHCFLSRHVTNKNLIVHDGYSDPLGWNSTSKSSSSAKENIRTVNVYTQLVDDIKITSKEYLKQSEIKIAVIIDGLNVLLRHKSSHEVCRLINSLSKLSNKVEAVQIIATIQKDVVSQSDIDALSYIADANIVLDMHHSKTSRNNRGFRAETSKFQADVTLRKKSGKVLRENVLCMISKDFSIKKLSEIDQSVNDEEEMQEADPTKNLSFNLKLTDSEKQARSQVKLPYTLDQEQKAVYLDRSAGTGKIIYQPDDADDFDEEDPDEDLDI